MKLIGDHCELLYEAGLIKDYKATRGGTDNMLLSFSIGNLTNRGYDYQEFIRNNQIWISTNEEVKKKKLSQTIETFGIIATSITGAFKREYNR